MRDPGLGVVGHRPAQLLESDRLARDRLDHLWPGDEHVRGLLHHEHEVRDRRRIHRPAGARAHDQADLRDHSGRAHVAHEHLAIAAERYHALLDPSPARVVDPDDRAAGLLRQLHHLDHLLAHRLTQRPTEHREVLAEHAHPPAVDQAETRHHRVRVRPVRLHLEIGRPMPHEHVQLLKRPRVQQLREPLTRGVLTPRMLLLSSRRANPHESPQYFQRLKLARSRLDEMSQGACSWCHRGGKRANLESGTSVAQAMERQVIACRHSTGEWPHKVVASPRHPPHRARGGCVVSPVIPQRENGRWSGACPSEDQYGVARRPLDRRRDGHLRAPS